ncbi:hypothetical protein V8E55_005011 [Tylopilus felleus]
MEHRRRRHTELVQDALKFLIHFLGDAHQPLHLTGCNRGNGDKVAFDGPTTSACPSPRIRLTTRSRPP